MQGDYDYSQYLVSSGNNSNKQFGGDYYAKQAQCGSFALDISKNNPYSKANYEGYNNFDLSQFYTHHNHQQQHYPSPLYKPPSQYSQSPYTSNLLSL